MARSEDFSLWRGETPIPKGWSPSVVPGVKTVATPLLSADKVPLFRWSPLCACVGWASPPWQHLFVTRARVRVSDLRLAHWNQMFCYVDLAILMRV